MSAIARTSYRSCSLAGLPASRADICPHLSVRVLDQVVGGWYDGQTSGWNDTISDSDDCVGCDYEL